MDYPVTAIADDGFSNLTNVKKITLPDSIEKIGDNAFSNSSWIWIIILATSVPELGTDAFEKLPRNFKIVVPEGTLWDYRHADGWKLYKNHIIENDNSIEPDDPEDPDDPNNPDIPEMAENNGMVTVNVPTVVNSKDVTINNYTVLIKKIDDDEDKNKKLKVKCEGWSDEY